MIFFLLRELDLIRSEGTSHLRALLFFDMTAGLAPLAFGPETDLLARLGGGFIWILALLSVLLSLDRLFQPDLEDGSWPMMLGMPSDYPDQHEWRLLEISTAKMIGHWMVTGLPLTIIAPLCGIWYELEIFSLIILSLTLFVGSSTLTAIGAIGASLLVTVPRGNILVTVIVMPLYVPILILGTLAVDTSQLSSSPWPLVQAMIGISLITCTLAPFMVAKALKVHIT